jgi:quercetin dioxygenase-like cupin family protein
MNPFIVLPTEIGTGKMQEVETLFADAWRRLVCIRLRQGALLADHSARVPITIHALLGRGVLQVEDEEYHLTPGMIVPVDAHARHSVQADPEIALLVTFFRQPEPTAKTETPARVA